MSLEGNGGVGYNMNVAPAGYGDSFGGGFGGGLWMIVLIILCLFGGGFGGFGGSRGPSRPAAVDGPAGGVATVQTQPNQAALYRLLGDRHHIHVDPEAARRIGQDRPILHGLASLTSATLALADLAGAHPADLVQLAGRFAGVVFPGDLISVRRWEDGRFDALVEDRPVITEGLAVFQ